MYYVPRLHSYLAYQPCTSSAGTSKVTARATRQHGTVTARKIWEGFSAGLSTDDPLLLLFSDSLGEKRGAHFALMIQPQVVLFFGIPSFHPSIGAKGAVGFSALTRSDARIGGTVAVRKQPHHALECSSQWRIWCFRFRFPARVLCLPELRAQCCKKRYGNLLTGPVTRGPDRCLDRLLHKCRSLSGRASG